MIEVSVGLCSRNRHQTLREVLLSLCDQSLEPERFEVVLVDDGSLDATREMVQALRSQLPYALTYLWQSHSGLAAARNTGIRAARGEIMVYIDDDVLAHPQLLSEHLKVHRRHPHCVCNGWVNHVSEAVRPSAPRFTPADISTSFFWTSNVSVRVKHLKQAGLFDEDFREYGWEDQELGLRLMALGLRKQNNYQAIGFHIKRPPTRAAIPTTLAQAAAKARSARIYVAKHRRLRSRFSTGMHPPRMALARLANLGGAWERHLRSRLGVSSEGELLESVDLDRPLTKLEQHWLKELATVVYFRGLERQ